MPIFCRRDLDRNGLKGTAGQKKSESESFMSGFQEILVILLILLGVLYLPRRGVREGAGNMRRARRPLTMSGRVRLAIALSVLWPAALVFYLRPWEGDPLPFLGFGLLPVAAGWAAAWVVTGYRRYRR